MPLNHVSSVATKRSGTRSLHSTVSFSYGDTVGLLPCGLKLRVSSVALGDDGVSEYRPTVPFALYVRNTACHASHRLYPLLLSHHTLEARVSAQQQDSHSLMQPPMLAWLHLASMQGRRTQFLYLNLHHNTAA